MLRLIDFLKEMAKEEDFTCLHQRRKDFSSRKVNIVSQAKKEALREDSYTSSGISLSAVISIED